MKNLDLDSMKFEGTARKNTEVKLPVKRELGYPFLKGPIPLAWLERAACLGGKALHVAISLWFLRGVTKRTNVRFNQSHQERYGVKRDAARRGIKKLEAEGLITVQRRSGQSLEVFINEVFEKVSVKTDFKERGAL